MTCQVIKFWNVLPSYSLVGSLGQGVPIAFKSIYGLADWIWAWEPTLQTNPSHVSEFVQLWASHRTSAALSFASLHYILFLLHRMTVGTIFCKMFYKLACQKFLKKILYVTIFKVLPWRCLFSPWCAVCIYSLYQSILKYWLIMSPFCSKKALLHSI